MAKHQRKVADALATRQELTPPNVPGSKFFYHKPGSQNMKKGYRQKNAKRGRK